MEIVNFIENEAYFHPQWQVRYEVTIKPRSCTIDFGSNTIGVEGTFWVRDDNKMAAVAACLEKFLNWYAQFKQLTQPIADAIMPR